MGCGASTVIDPANPAANTCAAAPAPPQQKPDPGPLPKPASELAPRPDPAPEREPPATAGSKSPSAVQRRRGPRAGQWKKGQLLAKGAHGAVYMGLDERTGGLIAVKEIAFTPRDKQMVLQLQAEVELLAACQHPNIIRYLGTEVERADSSEDESLLYIFSEWVPGGSIHTVIQRFGRLAESVRDEDSFPIVF
jgi:serine/threonine protein kinase